MNRLVTSTLAAILAVTPLGCSSHHTHTERIKPSQPAVPTYSTNTNSGETADFGDKDFNSSMQLFDFGDAGKRVVGILRSNQRFIDTNGRPIKDALDIWTLKSEEIGYEIDTSTKRMNVIRADSTVRAYVEQKGVRGFLTDIKYENRIPSGNERIQLIGEPVVRIPLYKLE